MRLKHKIIIWKKEYLVWELTVWLYLLFLQDLEQFLQELFLEFNSEVPEINKNQLEIFMQEYFEQKSSIKTKNQKSKQEIREIILVNIWIFTKHIWWNYLDICSMPIKTFSFMLDKIEFIFLEKKFVFSENQNKNERKKLKDLFDNQKIW